MKEMWSCKWVRCVLVQTVRDSITIVFLMYV
ncbi:MAG: hypothetical protein C5S48_08085 [Candidatus Methanogaster sp.]|nr:MAG: hypothetical protein C5S48_08085 [ANME-2 cluster archaeon]